MRAERLAKALPGILLGGVLLLASTGCRSTRTATREDSVVLAQSDSLHTTTLRDFSSRIIDSLQLATVAEFDSVEIQAGCNIVTLRARGMRVNAALSRRSDAQTSGCSIAHTETVSASESVQKQLTEVSKKTPGLRLPWWIYPALAIILCILIKKHTRL